MFIETFQAFGTTVQWASHIILSAQDHAPAGITMAGTATVFAWCEGCDIVQSDHAPQAGVAQVIFHGDLIRRRDGHQVELEEELEEKVERRVRRDHSRNKTQAHAWMIWNDTQGETLSHKCDV